METVCKNCNNWQPPEKELLGPYVVEGLCLHSITKMRTFPYDTCLLFEPKTFPIKEDENEVS